MHNGVRFEWNFQRQPSGGGREARVEKSSRDKGWYRNASRQKSRKGGKSGENDGGGLPVAKLSLEFIEIHGGYKGGWLERKRSGQGWAEYERDSSVDDTRGFPLAFLKTGLKTGHRERGIVARSVTRNTASGTGEGDGKGGKQRARKRMHMQCACRGVTTHMIPAAEQPTDVAKSPRDARDRILRHVPLDS